MKTFMTLFAFATLLLGSSAFASQYHLVETCTYPLMEGEFQVYLAADKQSAKVVISGQEYEAINFHLGPVMHFDVETHMGTERIIIAVDGGHELHLYNPVSNRFEKVKDLNCY